MREYRHDLTPCVDLFISSRRNPEKGLPEGMLFVCLPKLLLTVFSVPITSEKSTSRPGVLLAPTFSSTLMSDLPFQQSLLR